jgi:phosphoserine phosphatase
MSIASSLSASSEPLDHAPAREWADDRDVDACVPIVVDLDGTLVATDTLVESIIKLIARSPLNLLRMVLWLVRGRATFKAEIGARVSLAVELLPFNASLLAYLRAEKAAGRRIILATAADESIARRVSEHLNLFDDVLASNGERNLKGTAKLTAIRDKIGNAFVYAGDSAADVPIWEASKQAILVGVSPRVTNALRGRVVIVRVFPRQVAGVGVWARALRVHQWTKNSLLFVPLLTSFGFLEVHRMFLTAVAFLALSLTASATYVLNDLWDLDNDRVC